MVGLVGAALALHLPSLWHEQVRRSRLGLYGLNPTPWGAMGAALDAHHFISMVGLLGARLSSVYGVVARCRSSPPCCCSMARWRAPL